jgi:hypothetical protein
MFLITIVPIIFGIIMTRREESINHSSLSLTEQDEIILSSVPIILMHH